MVSDSVRAIFYLVLSLVFSVPCVAQTASEVMERSSRVEVVHGQYKLDFNGRFFDVFQKVLESGELARKQMTAQNGSYSLSVGGDRFEVFPLRRLVVDCSAMDATNLVMCKELLEGKANNFELGDFVLAGEQTLSDVKCWKITRTLHSAINFGAFGDIKELENYVAKDTFRVHARIAKGSDGKPVLSLKYTDFKEVEMDDNFFSLPAAFEKVIPKTQEEYLAVLQYAVKVSPTIVGQNQHIDIPRRNLRRDEARSRLSWTFWGAGFVTLAFLSLKVADFVLSSGAKRRKKRSHV